MKKSKIVLLLLLISVIFTAFAACKDGYSVKKTTDNTATEESEGLLKPNVPDGITFGGATFTVGSIDPNLYPSTITDFDFEYDSADVVDSSIYRRNLKIEAQYNVNFENVYMDISDTLPKLNEQIASGDETFQLLMLISREAWPSAMEGYLILPEDIPYFDPTQPWYMSKINDAMKVSNRYIIAYTDESMNTYMQSVCVFFNQQIIEDNQALTSPYTLVKDGTWTLEKFYELCNVASWDENSDGSYSPLTNDRFGVISENDMLWPSTWVGAEVFTIKKDANDIPYFAGKGSERLINILEELNTNLKIAGFYCNSEDFFGSVNENGDAARDSGTEYFSEGGALFRVGTVGNIQLLRSMDSDFGVVPLPKYDEDQETYYSRVIDGWLHVAPSNVSNTELLGVMIEALGCESRNYVIPAFFDVALDNKYVRDGERESTLEMLNMIFENAIVDLGDTVWLPYVRGPICDIISRKTGGFASKMKSIETIVEKNAISTVTEFVETLEKN